MEDHLKRLESVTNRLEAVAKQLSSGSSLGQSGAKDSESTSNNVDHLPIIRDYVTLINESLQPFLTLSQKIGGDVAKISEHVSRLFQAQQQFICKAVQSKKLVDKQLIDAIKPQSSEIEAIIALTSKSRKSPHFNHLSTVSEGIPALSWIVVTPTPGPHIKDMCDAAQFYSNRVLKEFREKDPTHVEWVKVWMKVLNDLYSYVRQYHTTGLAWSSQGKLDFNSLNTTPTKPTSGGAPPPPPPMGFDTPATTAVDNSRNELMSSINTLGEGVTSHLKKVPDALKTHKNPQLRQQADSEVTSHKKTETTASSKTSTTAKSGSPKVALEGNKWIVEYQTGQSEVRITETNMKHSIYIYKCTNSTIIVEGKVNSVVLDQCTKVGLQITSVVSLIEFINCKSMKAQVLERVPTIQIEKTDGCHIYLSKTSLNTEFITSKSSEMSINIPDNDDEYKEYPIPEQFKTYLKGGKQLVTVANESAGV